MVGYFEGKLQYFGESLLTKRIQFNDLDNDDQACVQAGHLQVLPSRDRSGRAIVVAVDIFENKSFRTPTNKLKANIYSWLTLAEDEENQKRGVVLVVIQLGAVDFFARANPTLAREYPRAQSWFPLRVCAVHCCSDTALAEFLLRAAVIGAPAEMRARHRSHNGTYTEILYSLVGYGIPVDLIPSNDGMNIKKTNWNRWIAKYMARDKELSRGRIFLGVDLPTRNDVLMGKGRPIQNHHGNVHLRILVESLSYKYHVARSTEKSDIVHQVFAMVQATHGRFLRKDDDGWWRELTNAEAVEKVRKLFQRPSSRTETLQHGASTQHATPDDGGGYGGSMFLQQGKRPRFGGGCCGT